MQVIRYQKKAIKKEERKWVGLESIKWRLVDKKININIE